MSKDLAPTIRGGKEEPTQSQEYRTHTGAEDLYDLRAALQFNLLSMLGLRDEHYLLDIGCGSLCAGRLLIPYLRPGHYFGIEPLEWLVKKGIEEELGQSAVDIKKPTFHYDENFTLTAFGRKFDFLLAQSIFSHTSQAQLRRCLSEAAKVMKPGSVFVATFFEGAENYTGDRWIAHADYTMDKMRELVKEQGLIMHPIEWDHQDLQRWILILHPQTTVAVPEFNATSRAIDVNNQLARSQQHLAKLRSHPYVKIGYKIRFFLVTARFALRRVRRALIGG
jgi:SAM-dependent methyltransferase